MIQQFHFWVHNQRKWKQGFNDICVIRNSQDMEITQMLINGWIKKMWYIYTIKYYLAFRKDDILPFATTEIDLGHMFSKVSQRKVSYHITHQWLLPAPLISSHATLPSPTALPSHCLSFSSVPQICQIYSYLRDFALLFFLHGMFFSAKSSCGWLLFFWNSGLLNQLRI